MLSPAESQQIYAIWSEESARLSSYCATDSTCECIYPYIGLRRDAGVSNVNNWRALSWTDGNELAYVNWGVGEPDISNW